MQIIDQSPNAPTPLDQMRAAESLKSKVREIINRNPISMGNIVEAPGAANFPMAQRDQSGLAIVNLSSPHYGSLIFTQIADTAEYAKVNAMALTDGNIDMSKATGASAGAGIINHDTSNITDNANFSQTADYGSISGLPPGVLSAQAVGTVQANLGSATGTQILSQTGGGAPAWIDQYGSNVNIGFYNFADLTTASISLVQWGATIDLPNPSVPVVVEAILTGYVGYNAAANSGTVRVEISLDGGATWSNATGGYPVLASVTSGQPRSMIGSAGAVSGTPTGDIQCRAMVGNTIASNLDYKSGFLILKVWPNSTFSVLAGALSLTLPATKSTSCSAAYPTTSCSASTSITGAPSGGTGPYTYSNSRTGGTGAGTITSGATAQTFTVSCSETTTDAGASYTDTYKQIVTDSLSATANASCTVTSTFYRTYSPISASISRVNGRCTASAGSCTASGTFSVSATGGNGSYTYSNSISGQSIAGVASITSGATASSGTFGGTYTVGNTDSFTLNSAVNDTRSTGTYTASTPAQLAFVQV